MAVNEKWKELATLLTPEGTLGMEKSKWYLIEYKMNEFEDVCLC